ncbi:MAG: 50S ribosomal protein L18 [Phycisphaeraceae bacterium]|nr:50S ribosomal protein L18 [Phycisphaeraceae bacterium]
MNATKVKKMRMRRKTGIRKRVNGTAEKPRLTVYRSLKHIYAQIIDDLSGRTVVADSSMQAKATGANRDAATEVGKRLADKARAAGISQVAFDRNGFRYHGRVKALADAAREGGLKF